MTAPFSTTQIMMTLAALAYTSPTQDIARQLRDTSYATNGQWDLVWGPVVARYPFDNMAFVVKQRGTKHFAVVLRGTVFNSLRSWCEDVPEHMISFDEYTNGTDCKVSKGFYDGLESLMEEESGGQSMAQFLQCQAPEAITVAGHSQGAALAPMALAWLMTELSGSDASFSAYAFAQPSPGDQNFAAWINDNATCHVINNTRDVVPYAYGQLMDVIERGIPAHPNDLEADLIKAMSDHADWVIKRYDLNGVWSSAGAITQIETPTPPDPKTGFLDLVALEHDHNTYLTLLGAPTVRLSTCSMISADHSPPLPGLTAERIGTTG